MTAANIKNETENRDTCGHPAPSFALVLTNDPALPRWQVHDSRCSDALEMLRRGGFVDYVSADSAEEVVSKELSLYALAQLDGRWSNQDFEIIACSRVAK